MIFHEDLSDLPLQIVFKIEIEFRMKIVISLVLELNFSLIDTSFIYENFPHIDK